MDRLYIMARIAGVAVAFPIDAVHSAIRIGQPVPVPGSSPAIAGLVALRSTILTLIDCAHQLEGRGAAPRAGDFAIVFAVGGQDYGLMVDAVSDVAPLTVETDDAVRQLSGGWRAAATAVAQHEGQTVLILDPRRLILPDMAAAA